MDPLQRLHSAIQVTETNQVEQILLDPSLTPFRLNSKDPTTGQTALHLAAKIGNEKVMQLILAKGDEININSHDEYHGYTPLILACQQGHVTIVNMILTLRKDCDVNLGDLRGSTALHFACVKKSLDIVQLLVQHGAQIDKKNNYGNLPLHRAASVDAFEIIKYLVEFVQKEQRKRDSSHNGDHSEAPTTYPNVIEMPNNEKQRILHFASLNGCVEVVRYLVEVLKADLEARDENHVTPLHIAAMNAHEEIVDILLRNHANVDCRDCSNESPLMKASYKGFLNVVKQLTTFKANLDLKERASGMTALILAALHKEDDIVKYLVEQGADVHAENHDHKTALHYAVAHDSIQSARLLLERGADPCSNDFLMHDDITQEMRELILDAQKSKQVQIKMDEESGHKKKMTASSEQNVPKSTRIGPGLRAAGPSRTTKPIQSSMRKPSTPTTPLSGITRKTRPSSATPTTPRRTVRKRSGSHSSREDSVGKSARKSNHTPHSSVKSSQKVEAIAAEPKKKKTKRLKKKVKTQSSLTKRKFKGSKKSLVQSSPGHSVNVSGSSSNDQEQSESPLAKNGEVVLDSPRLIVTQHEDTMNDMIGNGTPAMRDLSASPGVDAAQPRFTTLAESMRYQRQHIDPINTHMSPHQRKMMRLQSLTPTEKLFAWSEVGVTLGRGAYGEVILAITEHGSLIAVKRLSISNGNWKRVEKEVKLLQRLNHMHICRYLGCQLSEDGCSSLDILLEYCSEGTLNAFLKQIKRATPRIRSLQIYMRQILLGLKYIHDMCLLHRDIKPDNCLVHSSGMVKLADFGCSKVLSDSLSRVSQQGTPEFFSPELIRDEVPKGYEKSIDIWALGVVAWELACGRSLWHEPDLGWSGTNRFQLMFKIANITSDPKLPERLKLQSLRDFVQCCLRVDPRERHSVDQLLKHPFLTDKSFHNLPDEEVLLPAEGTSKPEVVNLLNYATLSEASFDSATTTSPEDKCLDSLQGDDSICRMDSVIL